MANLITINEPSVDILMGTWTGIELWHASSSDGPFTLLVEIPYVLDQTTYTFNDTEGQQSDWYEVRRYGPGSTFGTFSDVWSVSRAVLGRRSLQNVRRILARALHSLTLVTTTLAGRSDGTSVIAPRLATAVDANRHFHTWVLPVNGLSGGEISRVRDENALNLTSGELMVAPAFSEQIASGVDVEVHRLLPPDDDDGWTGLRTCVNDALRECWTPARLSITGVEGQPSYSLAAYEDWLDTDAVLELRRQALDSTLNAFATGSFDTVRSADSLTLQVSPTLPGADASTLEVFRPADTWIKVGGVWATSTTGLVNDSDEMLLNPDLVVTVALAHAYAALASGPEGSRYDSLAQKARLKANIAKEMQLDHRQRRVGTGLYSSYGAVDPKSFQAMREEW
jgi:hypothetical protein